MTVPGKETPANSVPAAAVIRRGLALFGITGRKAYVGGLSSREVSGIPSVEVKFVDIWRNTSGEGGSLARY